LSFISGQCGGVKDVGDYHAALSEELLNFVDKTYCEDVIVQVDLQHDNL
jgi:hypothetical protein